MNIRALSARTRKQNCWWLRPTKHIKKVFQDNLDKLQVLVNARLEK